MSAPDVPAPAGPSSPSLTAAAPASRRSPAAGRSWWWSLLLAVVGTACLIAAVPLFRHGIVTHPFPSYVQNDPAYAVARWSAPWVGGAIVAGGAGLICWLLAVVRLASPRRRPQPLAGPDGQVRVSPGRAQIHLPEAQQSGAGYAGLAPRPTEAAREY